MIIRDGYPFLGAVIVVTVLVSVFLLPWFWMIGLLLFLFFANFFRDPEREVPEGRNLVSPADGKVIKLEQLNEDSEGYGYFISIFMSVIDVHVNRAPMAGKITDYKYFNGIWNECNRQP